MKKTVFIKILNETRKVNKLPITISDEQMYIGFINEECKNTKNFSDKEKDAILISQFYSLFWGTLALSINHDNEKYTEIEKMTSLCLHTMSVILSNNIISITKLACKGFDFQSSVLLRNTFELAFGLLALLLDEDVLKAYFNSAKNNNEYEVWNKYFRFSKLNQTLMSFEKSLSENDEEMDFITTWRKNNYSYYTQFAHNSFFHLYINCFGHPTTDNPDEVMPMNLWGLRVTRINETLDILNSLMFYTSLVFYKIINVKQINILNLVKDDSKDLWNDSFILRLMGEHLFLKKVKNNEKDA